MALKIFLVEDDTDDCHFFQVALATIDEAIQLECSNECIGLIEKLEMFKPDLIFLDLLLPKVEGFDCLNELTSQRITNTPVIVFTSAVSLNELPIKAIGFGAKIYLEKPHNLNTLVENLKFILNLDWHEPETIKPLHIKENEYRHL